MNDLSLAQAVREARIALDAMPPGDERDARERQLGRFGERLREMPARVAARGEMKPRAEMEAILREECAHVVDALRSTDG
jgi:hypothetical protein